MMMMTPTEPAVHALLTFLASRDTQAVYIPSVAGAGTVDAAQGTHTQVSVPVHNARLLEPPPTLDRQGFQLVPQKLDDDNDHGMLDFYDDNQVETVYHEAVKELLRTHIPGVARVEIFDDTRRASSDTTRSERQVREPSANVHNDYTPRSAMWRLQDYFAKHYPDESLDDLLSKKHKRWCIVNVWRSISHQGPVLNYPMVLCDSTTVNEKDVLPVERKSAQRTGEIQMPVYNENQRWYYYPQMQRDEALLIKTFDSAAWDCKTIHTSFNDPMAPANAPARESMETRCFVFLDE